MRLDDVIYWLKGKTGLDSDEENDQRSIECGLIRCMSELKNKELDSVKLSEDFQHRFLMELDKTEQEYQEESFNEKFSSILNAKGFRYSMAFASLALVSTFMITNLNESSDSLAEGIQNSNIQSSLDPSLYRELNEEFQLINEIRQNPDDIHCLKRLEEHYNNNGNIERASRIHYTLETISK